jgi:hypothetical protein
VQCLQTLNAALGNIGDHEKALAVAETIATFSGVPSSNVADTSPKQSLLSLVADLGRS